MSGYVREKAFKIDFQGDSVAGTLLPLSQVDLLALTGRTVSNDDDAAMAFTSFLPRYVTNFAGPKAADGSDVTLEEVCTKAYFIKLVVQIGGQLLGDALPPSPPSETSAS